MALPKYQTTTSLQGGKAVRARRAPVERLQSSVTPNIGTAATSLKVAQHTRPQPSLAPSRLGVHSQGM